MEADGCQMHRITNISVLITNYLNPWYVPLASSSNSSHTNWVGSGLLRDHTESWH